MALYTCIREGGAGVGKVCGLSVSKGFWAWGVEVGV